MKKVVLLVTILAIVLGGSSLALAQTDPSSDQSATNAQPTTEQTTNTQPTSDQTTNTQPTSDQTTNTQPTTEQTTTDPSADVPCGVGLFRLEQQELVQNGYPTPVSAKARECENLGYVNPYPAPALLGPDGFVYPYDPIEGQYMYLDPSTGLYYTLDPATDTVSTYDPASGTFL